MIKKMSLAYIPANYKSLVYSDMLKEESHISVNLMKMERKYNNDLKLLMNEILFLILYVEMLGNPIKVIYMGAAPGFHLIKLLKMFMFIEFDLYDPEPLHPELQQYVDENPQQVRYYPEKFDVLTCEHYVDSPYDIYLITDHRDVKFNKDPIYPPGSNIQELKDRHQADKEASYMEDMKLQMEVCKVLKPKFANLRFRPPHFYNTMTIKSPEPAIFNYFFGTIWLMIYNDFKSTESRIVVSDYSNDSFAWNYKSYQYRLNFFNSQTRELLVKNPFSDDNTPLPYQLGNRFEIVMVFKILKDYLATCGYENARVSDVAEIYSEFLVVESCSKSTICPIVNETVDDVTNEVRDFDINDIDDADMLGF